MQLFKMTAFQYVEYLVPSVVLSTYILLCFGLIFVIPLKTFQSPFRYSFTLDIKRVYLLFVKDIQFVKI